MFESGRCQITYGLLFRSFSSHRYKIATINSTFYYRGATLMFLFFRWSFWSTWNNFHETLRIGRPWRWWLRCRKSSHSAFVGLFCLSPWSCGRSPTLVHVRYQAIFPFAIGSLSLYRLCSDWHHDLSKSTRKFEETILLKDQSMCRVPKKDSDIIIRVECVFEEFFSSVKSHNFLSFCEKPTWCLRNGDWWFDETFLKVLWKHFVMF